MTRPTYLRPGESMRPLKDREGLALGTIVVTRFGRTGGQRAILYKTLLDTVSYAQARKWSNRAQQWTKTVRIVQRAEIRGVVQIGGSAFGSAGKDRIEDHGGVIS